MKKKIFWAFAGIFLAALVAFAVWQTQALELNTCTVKSDQLPTAFDGYRIAQVSDLHNACLGKDNEKLLTLLRQAEPDIIAITGDMIDSRNTDVEIALAFAAEAVRIAPCYYVTGNHEARVPAAFRELRQGLAELGVTVLQNESLLLERAGETITLIGVDDPQFRGSTMDRKLAELVWREDFTVLLSHRPELFETYVQSGADLVLSGHAHGGQIRLPFVGAVIAPNQGFFPEYSEGMYTDGGTNMVVSRGIGNSVIPFRFLNPPEVVLVILGQ